MYCVNFISTELNDKHLFEGQNLLLLLLKFVFCSQHVPLQKLSVEPLDFFQALIFPPRRHQAQLVSGISQFQKDLW